MDVSGEQILMVGSLLLIIGVLIGKTSYRTGLPLLLIFLFVGMLFGTDGLGIQFDNMHIAQIIGMIALCIILFSGGLSTSISAIRPVIAPGLVLSTAGVLITAAVTGLFIFWLSGMQWTNIHFALIPSMLLASTMSSTDSASVFGILGSKNVGLRHNLRPMLELESGSNDPMAYMLTIILVGVCTSDHSLSASEIISQLIMQFGIGGLCGFMFGYLGVKTIKLYHRIEHNYGASDSEQTSMTAILVIATAFLTYTATTLLAGNGYLAVYMCGILIGNAKMPYRKNVSNFMDGITWLAQIVVFIMLGLLVNPHEMLKVAAVSTLIGIFMIFVGRPISVMLCLAPFRKIGFKSKLFVSWVGLRGAVPIIFATYPVVANVEGASMIFNIVFFVTILSLLIQGTTIVSAARKLKLIDPSAAKEDEFGVDIDDERGASLHTLHLTEKDLQNGNTLKDMTLPEGSLVIMIKRGNKYMVPNGSRKLHPGDSLLVIREDKS